MTNNFNKKLGNDVREWRVAHGYSLSAIAGEYDCTSLSRFERGENRDMLLSRFFDTYIRRGYSIERVLELWQEHKTY